MSTWNLPPGVTTNDPHINPPKSRRTNKAEWAGHIMLRVPGDDDSERRVVSVRATHAPEAVERALRQVLAGQPRRAEKVYEVTISLARQDQ